MPFNEKDTKEISIQTDGGPLSLSSKILNFVPGFGVNIETAYVGAETVDIRISSEIQQYTDADARNAVTSLFLDTSTIDLNYNPGTPSITASVIQSAIEHQNITGAGTNTHTQIDSHIANVSNPHSTTKAQLGLGSVENTALSTWPGTTNITTLGTISTGSVPFSLVTGTVPVNRGGTGLTTAPTDGQILIGNGGVYDLATITAGNNIIVTNGPGSIRIDVDPVAGQPNVWSWAADDNTYPSPTPTVTNSANGIAIGEDCHVTNSQKSFSVGYANSITGGSVNGIFGGENNVINGSIQYGYILGGHDNIVTGNNGLVAGGYSNTSSANNAILAGNSNTASGTGGSNTILNGTSNTISGTNTGNNIVLAGGSNTVNGGSVSNTIVGSSHTVGTTSDSNLITGSTHTVTNAKQCLVSGYSHNVTQISSTAIKGCLVTGAYGKPFHNYSLVVSGHDTGSFTFRSQAIIVPLRSSAGGELTVSGVPTVSDSTGVNRLQVYQARDSFTFKGIVTAANTTNGKINSWAIEGVVVSDGSNVASLLYSNVTTMANGDTLLTCTLTCTSNILQVNGNLNGTTGTVVWGGFVEMAYIQGA